MIYILYARNLHEEKEWRARFKELGYMIYDHMYPFRLACQKVTRTREMALRCGISLEQTAEDLAASVASKARREYAYEYFVDWYNENRRPENVAILGFRKGYTYDYAIQRLRDEGAQEVCNESEIPRFTNRSTNARR